MPLNKKILLISAPFEDVSLINASDIRPKGIKTDDMSHYPLGFAYLRAYLGPYGYKVRSLFLNNQVYETALKAIKEKIKKFNPGVIGLQVFTANRIYSFKLIEYIKNKFPDIKIIIGGIHSTIMYEQILKKYPFLIAVLGEGEITTLELLKELGLNNPDLSKIKGIAYNKKGQVVKTTSRELINDLNILPFPIHAEFFKNNKRKTLCLMTSRGCSFACSFCCLDAVSRRRVRLRSPKNVVDEIESALTLLPQIKKIWIEDDNFFIDNERVIAICDEIIKRKINKEFICSGRIKPINPKMIEKLKQANFIKVYLGLESGDNDILKKCHKGITQKDAIQAAKIFAKAGLEMRLFLIVGLPGETKKTIKETAKFMKKIQRIRYTPLNDFSLLVMYPGTEVYRTAKAGGIINDNYWLSDKPTPVFTLENSIEKLYEYKRYLLRRISIEYFLTPRGFIIQFFMIPYFLKFLTQNKRVALDMLSAGIKILFPERFFLFAKKVYNKNKT